MQIDRRNRTHEFQPKPGRQGEKSRRTGYSKSKGGERKVGREGEKKKGDFILLISYA
jgi:hypothetical protein